MSDLKNIKYIVIDVDGTMTDGGIYYDNNGNEIKKFNVRDAAGVFALRAADIKVMVLTGRCSKAVERRMGELHVDYLFQGVYNKVEFLERFMVEEGIDKSQLAYIGDDVNDYEAMRLADFKACPSDACEEIAAIADYRTAAVGGKGVVTEVARHILTDTGVWDSVMNKLYGISGHEFQGK